MMFADDTVLYYSHKDKDELYIKVEESLAQMYRWCNDNQITLIKKCEYVQFGYRKAICQNSILTLGDLTLNRVSQYKYLGTLLMKN